MSVHQFSPSILFGDAVSNHMLDTANALRNAGYASKIVCEHLPSEDVGEQIYSQDVYEQESSPDNILLLHFSLGYSEQTMAWLKQLPDKKVLVYHNITPHNYFYGIDDDLYFATRRGRRQLAHLAKFIDSAVGVSNFNCDELRANGWKTVHRLPISFDTKRYEIEPSKQILQWGAEAINILFVGRVAPNKKFEDLLLTFYFVKKSVLPNARLVLVGSERGMDSYAEYLHVLIEQLALEDVHFMGHVPMAELVAYYQSATVYLSMSEHEGFGVSLLESIYFDLPIVAYKSTAVPETLDGQGILFTEKRYAEIAELIGLLANDSKFRNEIVHNQRMTLNKFSYARFQEKLLTIVGSVSKNLER